MENWSEKSKKSRQYVKGSAVSYFDEYYWCEKCGKPSVFTALEQKHAYEVEKRYFLQHRKLCHECQGKSKPSFKEAK